MIHFTLPPIARISEATQVLARLTAGTAHSGVLRQELSPALVDTMVHTIGSSTVPAAPVERKAVSAFFRRLLGKMNDREAVSESHELSEILDARFHQHHPGTNTFKMFASSPFVTDGRLLAGEI